jgi:hypothetical protein
MSSSGDNDTATTLELLARCLSQQKLNLVRYVRCSHTSLVIRTHKSIADCFLLLGFQEIAGTALYVLVVLS